MRQSTRLVVNTVVTMGRMLLTVGIGLTITRLVLGELGKVDFGLLTAVGASGALLTMFRDALTNSAVRHMAYEIGRKDEQTLREVFSTAVFLYACGAAAALVVGGAVGPLVLHVMKMPPERYTALAWVYAINLLMIAVVLLSTPFRSALQAYQALVWVAVVDLLSRLLLLAAVVVLLWVPTDKMVSYVLLTLAATALTQLFLVALAMKRYPATRPRLRWIRRSQMRALTSFAGWKVFGDMNLRLRMQGTLFVLNVVYGPIVNAAYAIGINLFGYTNQVYYVFLQAIGPALTTLEGANRRDKVHELVIHADKLPLIICSPLMMTAIWEAETVLRMWLGLGQYPEHSALFAQLLLLTLMTQMIGTGQRLALIAKGQIRGITLVTTMPSLAVLLLSVAAVFIWHLPVWFMPAAALVMTFIVSLLITPAFAHRRIGMLHRRWMLEALAPVAVVLACQCAATAGLCQVMPASLTRLGAVLAANGLIALLLGWTVGLNAGDRAHIKRIVHNARQKFLPARNVG